MARVCIRHPFLLSENLCGRCGSEFCRDCLVYPRGQDLPFCVPCAVFASGVRVARTRGLAKRAIRGRVRDRRVDTHADAPAPIPAIVNSVPAAWAFSESDEPIEPRPEPVRAAVAHRPVVHDSAARPQPVAAVSWLDAHLDA
jgi:hypothetical protein